jgi:hypothetical protein
MMILPILSTFFMQPNDDTYVELDEEEYTEK